MTTFLHLADERDAAAIRRNGVRLPKSRGGAEWTCGVFATPLVPDYYLTHQWVRELKRRGQKSIVGVHFRVPDDEMVWAGCYNAPKQLMRAADSAAMLVQQRLLGFEVIIPRAIAANEVRAIRRVSQVVGWRFFPNAKGRQPCSCHYCQRGEIGGKKIRRRLGRG